jgi:hypothetical protein
VIRAGGMKTLFDGVRAPAKMGILLREFTHGHTRQLSSVLREHLLALTERTNLLDGITEQRFVDIDSLLRPVYGHVKQGASFGHAKIANKQLLRRGLSLVTTISTRTAVPVVAGIRLRAGKVGSGMITEAINTAKAAGARDIVCRGNSAFDDDKTITTVVNHGAQFSIVITKTPSVLRSITTIADDAWTLVDYPGAVLDPDTGELISDAEVAQLEFWKPQKCATDAVTTSNGIYSTKRFSMTSTSRTSRSPTMASLKN